MNQEITLKITREVSGLNKRKDIIHHRWFALENDILLHPDFHGITGDEFKVFVWIYGVASKINNDTIRVHIALCAQQLGIKTTVVDNSIRKLLNKRWQLVESIEEKDARNASVTPYPPDGVTLEKRREEKKREENTKNVCFDFDAVYKKYPVRTKGPDCEGRFSDQIKTQDDYRDLITATENYVAHLLKPENSWRKPKQNFATFLGTSSSGFFWRDWINSDAGTTNLKPQEKSFREFLKERGEVV